MNEILIIVTPEKIFTFYPEKDKYVLQTMQGEKAFRYNCRSAEQSVKRYAEELKDELGYDSLSGFSVKAYFPDSKLKNSFLEVMSKIIPNTAEGQLLSLVEGLLDRLSADSSLRINDFGINLGEYCYSYDRRGKSKIIRSPFSLTAYTVGYDRLGEYIS